MEDFEEGLAFSEAEVESEGDNADAAKYLDDLSPSRLRCEPVYYLLQRPNHDDCDYDDGDNSKEDWVLPRILVASRHGLSRLAESQERNNVTGAVRDRNGLW